VKDDGSRSKIIDISQSAASEDIASAVAFLVGPDGGRINGQLLRAN
jgi:3-oxoacyl-[acyl-carrier protein] reductase